MQNQEKEKRERKEKRRREKAKAKGKDKDTGKGKGTAGMPDDEGEDWEGKHPWRPFDREKDLGTSGSLKPKSAKVRPFLALATVFPAPGTEVAPVKPLQSLYAGCLGSDPACLNACGAPRPPGQRCRAHRSCVSDERRRCCAAQEIMEKSGSLGSRFGASGGRAFL